MSLLVREITMKDGSNDFFGVSEEIYRNDSNWIPPVKSELLRILNPVKNPYFQNASLKFFICYSDGKPVSRSVLILNNSYWLKWNRKSAFFGFFESVNDIYAVRLLFSTMEADCKASGADYLEGPFNPNHYSELGILTDHFDESPVFFETYNPSYYPDLLLESGLTESKKFHTRINNNISGTISDKYKSSAVKSLEGDIKIRRFNIFRFRRDLRILRNINNEAFGENVFFLPLSIEEYFFSAKNLFFVTRPDLILIAEFKGKPVGAVQFALNINSLIKSCNGSINISNILSILWKRRKIRDLIIFSAGIKKSFSNKRVFAMLLKSSLKIFRKYSTLSTTWILDENLGMNLYGILGMSESKHFVMYSKRI